ncbi:S-layer homology domain-containing protein [Leptolyngbya sp. AN03gr2]|uniref:S-layer homology domain-containing protein n=1 Tax=unclassified Leptolyngbya TaxID=2650499 RepID=UPI003D319C06
MSISKMVANLIAVGTIASLSVQNPVQAQTTFPDVKPDYWAAPFIQPLVDRGIIRGFQDGNFRPNDPVTRAQFAVMVGKAFDRPTVRNAIRFTDVPTNYWAASDIQTAYREGFFSGYPGNIFKPAQSIPRGQMFQALSSGLKLDYTGSFLSIVGAFKDYESIEDSVTDGVTAAVWRRIAVNYPDPMALNPNRSATRAEVAASIYQALVYTGKAPKVESPYLRY